MNYEEVKEHAKTVIGNNCRVCKECNGRACSNRIPGPGAKGNGDTASRNYDMWKEIRLNIDTIETNTRVDTSIELFGKTFRFPFFAGPVGAINPDYSDAYNIFSYSQTLVSACANNGIAAFTGDAADPDVMKQTCSIIKKEHGVGIPTLKPWDMDLISEKMKLVNYSGAFAYAMDVDALGINVLRELKRPIESKSIQDLKDIVGMSTQPFLVKGVMTPKGAIKAKDAGADGIIVSNHGGRVQDQCPSTAEVLSEIVDAVGGQIIILVDGGLRSGADVFKALAIGADGVLITRPFIIAVYGGAIDGVSAYIDKIGKELEDTMVMCGAEKIADINREMLWHFK